VGGAGFERIVEICGKFFGLRGFEDGQKPHTPNPRMGHPQKNRGKIKSLFHPAKEKKTKG
jgi:hypothetical protein